MGTFLNHVDVLLALVVLAGMFAGWRRGFVLGTLGLAVLIAALLLAFVGYQYPAHWLEQNRLLTSPWAMPAAFLGGFNVMLLEMCAFRVLQTTFGEYSGKYNEAQFGRITPVGTPVEMIIPSRTEKVVG